MHQLSLLVSMHAMLPSRCATLRTRRLFLSRPNRSSTCVCRAFHQAKAQFTTIDSSGVPLSYTTDIRIGEAHEAYVYIEPSVGDATKSAVMQLLGGLSLKQDTIEELPLRFYHNSHHFAHESLPLPRVDIDRDLPRQATTHGDVSAATLWLSGNWYAITLNGSPDESFERASRESAQELRGALDKLKDH